MSGDLKEFRVQFRVQFRELNYSLSRQMRVVIVKSQETCERDRERQRRTNGGFFFLP